MDKGWIDGLVEGVGERGVVTCEDEPEVIYGRNFEGLYVRLGGD